MKSAGTAGLAARKCVPCEQGTPPLPTARVNALLAQLEGWQLVGASLWKEYRFPSYRHGLEFAYRLGQIAEEEGHHPEMWIGWERVKVTLTTFAIKGLSENDFILAAKADQAYTGEGAPYPRFQLSVTDHADSAVRAD